MKNLWILNLKNKYKIGTISRLGKVVGVYDRFVNIDNGYYTKGYLWHDLLPGERDDEGVVIGGNLVPTDKNYLQQIIR